MSGSEIAFVFQALRCVSKSASSRGGFWLPPARHATLGRQFKINRGIDFECGVDRKMHRICNQSEPYSTDPIPGY